MAKGGARRGAGRKRGGKNAKSAEIAQKAAAEGITPLEYLLNVMRAPISEEGDLVAKVAAHTLRFEAAKAAAPYMHPRLATHEVKGNGPKGEHVHRIEMVIVDHAD